VVHKKYKAFSAQSFSAALAPFSGEGFPKGRGVLQAECFAFRRNGPPPPFGVSFSPTFLHEQKNRAVGDKKKTSDTIIRCFLLSPPSLDGCFFFYCLSKLLSAAHRNAGGKNASACACGMGCILSVIFLQKTSLHMQWRRMASCRARLRLQRGARPRDESPSMPRRRIHRRCSQ